MFKDFVKAIQKNLQQMSKDSSRLFTVNVDTEKLYNLYLDSFPAGTNEIYRERREYDCSCCRHFIRDVGNVVSIKMVSYIPFGELIQYQMINIM